MRRAKEIRLWSPRCSLRWAKYIKGFGALALIGQNKLALLRNTSKVGMPAGNVSQITSFEFKALRELWGMTS